MQQDAPIEIVERATISWPTWLPEDQSAVFQSFVPAVETAGSFPRLSYSEEHIAAETDLEAVIAADLAAASAGTRIRITGSEAFVSRVLAAARVGGAIDAEIDATVTEAPQNPSRLRFFCIVCATTYSAEAGIGDVVRCTGCGTALLINHQFSSHQGAYNASPTWRTH
jgi:hypothetical protein